MASGSGLSSWRRVVTGSMAGGVLVLGLLAGAAAPAAFAVPTTGVDEPPAPTMTADQALAIIAKDYDTGAGGGQISQLIHEVLTLRQQGFKPSNANREAITNALDKRPNQTPLIDALKSTVSYQRKIQSQSNAASTGGTAGINQVPSNGLMPAPVFTAPGLGVQQPLG